MYQPDVVIATEEIKSIWNFKIETVNSTTIIIYVALLNDIKIRERGLEKSKNYGMSGRG